MKYEIIMSGVYPIPGDIVVLRRTKYGGGISGIALYVARSEGLNYVLVASTLLIESFECFVAGDFLFRTETSTDVG